ncbi:MAG: hypothetical protein ACAI38_08585 [Myxococcota bacterium]
MMLVKRMLVVLLATASMCAATNTNVKEVNARHQQRRDGCDCKCSEQPSVPADTPPPPTL